MPYKLAIKDIKSNTKDLIIEEDEAQDFLAINTGGEYTDSVKSEDIDGLMYTYLLELFKTVGKVEGEDEDLLKKIEAEVKKIHLRPSSYYKFTPQDLMSIYQEISK